MLIITNKHKLFNKVYSKIYKIHFNHCTPHRMQFEKNEIFAYTVDITFTL